MRLYTSDNLICFVETYATKIESLIRIIEARKCVDIVFVAAKQICSTKAIT